jgi:hypothetical protein
VAITLVRATSERARALLEPVREVGALAELADAKFDRAHPCIPGPLPIPVAPIGALGARMVVSRAADRIDLGTHERLDEGLDERAQHVGVSFLQVLAH